MIQTIIVILVLIIFGYEIHLLRKQNEVKEKTKISFWETFNLLNVPVITMKSNGKNINFLVDTGAEKSFIDSRILSSINCTEIPNWVGKVSGVNGVTVDTIFCDVELSFKEKTYNFRFQSFDFSKTTESIGNGVVINGILGSDFFDTYDYVIDFQEYIAYRKK